MTTSLRGSHGLSARRAQRTKSSRPEGPPTRSWGPDGPLTSSLVYKIKKNGDVHHPEDLFSLPPSSPWQYSFSTLARTPCGISSFGEITPLEMHLTHPPTWSQAAIQAEHGRLCPHFHRLGIPLCHHKFHSPSNPPSILSGDLFSPKTNLFFHSSLFRTPPWSCWRSL